jgi:chromosome partitioning protein
MNAALAKPSCCWVAGIPRCRQLGNLAACVEKPCLFLIDFASNKATRDALLLATRQEWVVLMHTIAILSQKGGTGKTTLALHLAVAAESDGRSVVVVDLDPQASAAGWKDTRATDAPVVVPAPSARLPHALAAAKKARADIVLIDSAPHSGDDALAAAEAADLVLIPCRAAILDLRAIATTARIVKLASKPAFVVLNAVPPRATQILADACKAVAVHELEVAPVSLQQRAAFAHSLTVGKTAQEYEPESKAAQEVARLYQWLKRQLNSELPNCRIAGKMATSGE